MNNTPNTPKPSGFPATPTDLRDYFAARAIRPQTFFPANLWQAIRWAFGYTYKTSHFNPHDWASEYYNIADAMLIEREKGVK